MHVKHWKDQAGNEFKEVVSRQYQSLVSLATEYMKKGARVWIGPFDLCAGEWVLTVMVPA